MKNVRINYLDFEIDKLTESLEHVASGRSFATDVSLVLLGDLKQVSRKKGWLFNWKTELNNLENEVYKLRIQEDSSVIQGLISVTTRTDHIYMNLVESAPFNRGKNKVYLGVLGNLVAFGCRLSLQRGFDGFVAFHAKTKLIDHYRKSLGASHFGGQLMTINSAAAKILIEKYFKQ